MIQQIRIQNFRSLKDVTLDLQQVNLLIGPNNSGKTNVLKALNFLGRFMREYSGLSHDEFERSVFSLEGIDASRKKYNPIAFSVLFKLEQQIFFYRMELYKLHEYKSILGYVPEKNLDKLLLAIKDFAIGSDQDSLIKHFDGFTQSTPQGSKAVEGLTHFWNSVISISEAYEFLKGCFQYIAVYKPNPERFTDSVELSAVERLNADGSNIVPFIFSLSQNYKRRFVQLEDDLKQAVGDIVGVSTPPDPATSGKLKLKFFDAYNNDYWADEVSEGVLYFLALLCIIHQPDPPKLLLLEEPEKGIHPRRIREVVDFIFDLAYDKGIQVIMTTHDTYVVDQFADIPEAVFVFDKKDGATEVKNLQKDIIEPADQLHTENGFPPTNYTRSLGEHWAAGFLGGVPR